MKSQPMTPAYEAMLNRLTRRALARYLDAAQDERAAVEFTEANPTEDHRDSMLNQLGFGPRGHAVDDLLRCIIYRADGATDHNIGEPSACYFHPIGVIVDGHLCVAIPEDDLWRIDGAQPGKATPDPVRFMSLYVVPMTSITTVESPGTRLHDTPSPALPGDLPARG